MSLYVSTVPETFFTLVLIMFRICMTNNTTTSQSSSLTKISMLLEEYSLCLYVSTVLDIFIRYLWVYFKSA